MTKPLHILVVDDDSDAADSLSELLEMEGHTVTTAYDGESAIEAYRSVDFDVAFMDIMMPGKNGYESFFEIRKFRPQAKVYMMTGFSVEQLVRQSIERGAMGVLSKPVDPQHILDLVDDIKPDGVVLIAEDDPDFGPQLAQILNDKGYACSLARTGAEALAAMRTSQIETLILDLNLPVIDGLEVYTTLKREGRVVPTLMITADAARFPKLADALNDMDVTGVLNKPFEPDVLLERLTRMKAA